MRLAFIFSVLFAEIVLGDIPSLTIPPALGSFAIQGRRPYQEDRHTAVFHTLSDGQPLYYYAVFDGHGGAQASDHLVLRLHRYLFSQPDLSVDSLPSAFLNAYRTADEEFLSLNLASGSTALSAVIVGSRLWVANTGDCRAVLSRGGKAVPLSSDHKPNRPDELNRLREAGSDAVEIFGVWRVEGSLAMSRAIGDRHLKHVVIPDPEVVQETLTQEDEFIILASDGLWDVFDNQDAVDFVRSNPKFYDDPKLAAQGLVTMAYLLGSMDNISVEILSLRPGQESHIPPAPVDVPDLVPASFQEFSSESEDIEFEIPSDDAPAAPVHSEL